MKGFLSGRFLVLYNSTIRTFVILQNGEIAMLGEITHLQAIIDDLTVLTTDPHKLPPASEQVQHKYNNTNKYCSVS